MNFKEYRKKETQSLRPYVEGEDVSGISIGETDTQNGSPRVGDMIAISKSDPNDIWLVNEKFFKENYVEA